MIFDKKGVSSLNIDNEILELIAKQIHKEYNRIQKERNPKSNLEYPTWESLPEYLKNSNLKQAERINEKLSHIGCYIALRNSDNEYVLTEEDVEKLAELEHQYWMNERKENGWTFDSVKKTSERKTPYFVPYELLEENIKELDRDTIRSIPRTLKVNGLIVCKKK